MNRMLYFLALLVPSCLTAAQTQLVLPTRNFSMNFCNFPSAWTVTQGDGIKIAVIGDDGASLDTWVQKLRRLAPRARIESLTKRAFLATPETGTDYHIVLLLAAPVPAEYAEALASIRRFTEKNVVVILPAYFGAMKSDVDYGPWRVFVRSASDRGAVIVGAHGRDYQVGNLAFWTILPVDVYALNERVSEYSDFKDDAMITAGLQDSAYLVAGATALLRAQRPELTALQIRQLLRQRGRRIYHLHADIAWQGETERFDCPALLDPNSPKSYQRDLQQYKREHPEFNPTIKESIDLQYDCLDAALLLGLEPWGSGEWSLSAARIPEAQKLATGRGVTVAILDWLFIKDDTSLKDRLYRPGSVIAGSDWFDNRPGHGTWMARVLTTAAPDAKIMPVRIDPDDDASFLRAIAYAVDNGAGVISLSHRAVKPEFRAALDQAVEKATQQSVVFAYVNYEGGRNEVLVPSPIEFAGPGNKGKEIFVIGTNFIDEVSFPYTWGVSQTAPLVAGVAAMLKQLNPGLSPYEIKRILEESYTTIDGEDHLLDALQAVTQAQSMVRVD